MIPVRTLILASLVLGSVGSAYSVAHAYGERERSYDVLHYSLDLRIDVQAGWVGGTVTMRLCPLRPLRSIRIDAARMTISDVTMRLRGRSPESLRFTTDSENLLVTLPETLNPTDTTALEISYSAKPTAGLYFTRPDSAYLDLPFVAWSQGETEENRDWFPCYDYPNDKATIEMRATVDEKFVAVSNGTLLEVTQNKAKKTRTFHSFCAKPVASYLISLVVGEYAQIKDWYKSVPLTYNVYPSQQKDALRSFGKTPEMMKFFSEKTGFDYPWPKYSQTVVPEFTYGGMENVSAATLTDRTIHSARAHLDTRSENLVAHELAHQWFGDLLTCRNWAHAWLNEGFATYFQALYDEASLGKDEFQHEMVAQQAAVVAIDTGTDRRPTVSDSYVDPVDMFDGHIYGRGACILHMLRFIIGEQKFWEGIKHYVDLYQYQCVTTEDFRHAMEDAAGQDLEWFFDEWVFHAGYPSFSVSVAYDSAASLVHIDVRQTQQVDKLTPLYRMPVNVEVSTDSGSVQHKIWIDAAKDQRIDVTSRGRPLNIVFDKGRWLLKALHFAKPVEMLVHQLEYGDAADRVEALDGLLSMVGQSGIRSVIAKALESDPFWGVRQKAAEVLGREGEPEMLQLLVPAFNDRQAQVRATATAVLKNFRTLDALVALGNIFAHDSSYAVAAEAIGALVAIDAPHAWEYCEKGLQRDSDNDIIRAAAVHALGTLRTEEAKRRLTAFMLYGQPPEVRLAAINALAQNWKSDDDVRRVLGALVNDRKHHVRRRAIERLGSTGDASNLAVLQAVIDHERNPILRREARKAIALIEKRVHPQGG